MAERADARVRAIDRLTGASKIERSTACTVVMRQFTEWRSE